MPPWVAIWKLVSTAFLISRISLRIQNLQTTRIFSPWLSHMGDRCSWHEVARPQVHGHDINCVAIIQGKGNHRFVCGADEKVARVFEAPLSFLKTLNYAVSSGSDVQEDIQLGVQILGANMSALGLSQKPIYVHGNSSLLGMARFKFCIM